MVLGKLAMHIKNNKNIRDKTLKLGKKVNTSSNYLCKGESFFLMTKKHYP